MGISTVSGPFRSQNGFQELVDGVWTPVGGGGGGGGGIAATVFLGDESSNTYFGIPDNRYSVSYYYVAGATAGTTIPLPVVEVGQSILINANFASSYTDNVWALEYPTLPGVDIATVWGSTLACSGDYPTYTADAAARTYEHLEGSEPSPYWYVYSYRPQNFLLTRVNNLVIPGYGTIALFMVQGTLFRVPSYSPDPGSIVFPDPSQFPIYFPY